VYLDGSAYYPPELLDRVATVRLIELEREHDELSILIPWFVQIDDNRIPLEVRQYIEKYLESKISTIPVAFKDHAREQRQLIQDILYNDQKLSTHDLENIDRVFEAQSYHAVFFVTTDPTILSQEGPLYKHFKLQAMRPSQCLPIIEEYLKKDQANYPDLFKHHF
jgi:hypothetical protein